MMDFIDFLPTPAILVICYLSARGWLWIAGEDERKRGLTPVLCGFLGGVFGLLSFYLLSGAVDSNPIEAIARGIVSGLAATGTDQIFKQQAKIDER